MDKLKENLILLRNRAGYTQKDLGTKVNVTFQTVSKWENGTRLPDISLLPKLAQIYEVSVDQLLGVTSLDDHPYGKRNKDTAAYRSANKKQFEASRRLYWNDDYLRFIIQEVWKINRPIRIAEIGCGTGIFANQLLACLPAGSTYTGYEVSDFLREEGAKELEGNPLVNLLSFDALYTEKTVFDLVVCQGYLRHQGSPLDVLTSMKSIARPGGLIACHEENRPFEMNGLLLGHEKDDSFEKGVFLEKMWETEMREEGRDYRMGLRLPLLLKQAGLRDIGTRLNDRVNVIGGETASQPLLDLINDHYALTSISEEGFMDFLLQRGLSRYEALRYIDMYQRRRTFMERPADQVNLVHTVGSLLSWGVKP